MTTLSRRKPASKTETRPTTADLIREGRKLLKKPRKLSKKEEAEEFEKQRVAKIKATVFAKWQDLHRADINAGGGTVEQRNRWYAENAFPDASEDLADVVLDQIRWHVEQLRMQVNPGFDMMGEFGLLTTAHDAKMIWALAELLWEAADTSR